MSSDGCNVRFPWCVSVSVKGLTAQEAPGHSLIRVDGVTGDKLDVLGGLMSGA